ncbi:MAG: nucleotide exchange factor GrpE [Clostridia bacterium]|nr:nucleotide exchange factor GrpE [Clostridia bacterium]
MLLKAEAKKGRKDKLAKEKKKAEKKTEAEEVILENEAEAVEEGTAEAVDERDAIIEELNSKLLDANDKLLRTIAEYDNFRKRSAKEKEAIYSDSKSDVTSKLLPVIDNFERAAAAETDLESYKKGIEMTVKQLLDVLGSLGVEAFGEKGEEFDPNFHNGVMHIDDENLGENVIADVYMKGYKMGDRVIRPATVIVAN